MIEIKIDEVFATPYTEEEQTQQVQAQTNAEARAYLASTDWYVIRLQETGVAVPQEILDKRAEARLDIV